MFRKKKRPGRITLTHAYYAYNTAQHESTKFTPFELMFSRSPVLPIDITEDASCQYEKLPEVTDGMCNSIIVMKFSECYYY